MDESDVGDLVVVAGTTPWLSGEILKKVGCGAIIIGIVGGVALEVRRRRAKKRAYAQCVDDYFAEKDVRGMLTEDDGNEEMDGWRPSLDSHPSDDFDDGAFSVASKFHDNKRSFFEERNVDVDEEEMATVLATCISERDDIDCDPWRTAPVYFPPIKASERKSAMITKPVLSQTLTMPVKKVKTRRSNWLPAIWVALFSLLGGALLWSSSVHEQRSSVQDRHVNVTTARRSATESIENVRVGDRVAGRNPIREQAELIEPDPETWRKISLRLSKASGHELWIELLRPLDWIEDYEADVGAVIEMDLEEMGAVGEALVTSIAPCPPIKTGTGAVVTGTFKHQADKNSNVVRLELEDQQELTRVTENHPYWSVDRQEFVPAGALRLGELVDATFGEKRIVSITPCEYRDFLYNLETTEHVYRVGLLGTLVHNSCVNRGGSYDSVRKFAKNGERVHHMPQAGAHIVSYGKGPALGMTDADHALTRTFSGRGRVTKSLSENPRSA